MPSTPDVNSAPVALRSQYEKAVSVLSANPVWANEIIVNPDIDATVEKVFCCSEYVAETVQRYPELLAKILEQDRLLNRLDANQITAEFESETVATETPEQFMRRLRLLRHRELIRIVWRDLSSWADCATTLEELSAVADVCIRLALQRATQDLNERYGEPLDKDANPAHLLVVAMGKLGGQELNFSSDIDVVFLFTANGETKGNKQGGRSISNEEYFRRVAQQFINLLSKQTVDGFVYRVDARLRPFGDSGPLACSIEAFEDYLLQQGRDWERYAWVKARIVNDWEGRSEFNRRVLRPFVYRRYLDFGVFGSLREMKSMIEREGRAAPNKNNIKLGPGGIREIEFIVQTLQLVRGGSIRTLRQRRLQPTLKELSREGLMPHDTVAELNAAYIHLRLVENRIQSIADRQTHELPVDEINQARLCLAMGVTSWDELISDLDHHRQIVIDNFDQILRHQRDESEADREESKPQLTALAEMYFEDADLVVEKIAALESSSVVIRMDDVGRQRLSQLMPSLLAACGGVGRPMRALEGVLRVLESIGRRSAYIALLNENKAALDRLVQLCATSDFLGQQVAAHPLLLDELLDPRVFSKAPTREDMWSDGEQRLAQADATDSEQRFEALRNFQQAAVFRIAVADMSGTLPLMKVSDRLTDIAEFVLQGAIDISFAELTAKHGNPCCVDESGLRQVGFAIVGYGKLGGLELGYGSDLDIVYVHDSKGEKQLTDGENSLDNDVFFGRLARRITTILTMPTPTGALYEVDTRLRPSGNSGLLVTSLAALERYQRDDAWTWEHQALLRARAVAGDAGVCEAFEQLRLRALTNYVKRDDLAVEVLKMRERMRTELNKSDADNFDIKQGQGGVVDIEFQVQYLALKHAQEHPSLIRYSDNIRQLEALQNAGLLAAEDTDRLADTYKAYRERMHELSLAGDARLVEAHEFASDRAHVGEVWNTVFPA